MVSNTSLTMSLLSARCKWQPRLSRNLQRMHALFLTRTAKFLSPSRGALIAGAP